MEKIITIHQPDFLPWLGFFDRWKNSHLLILLDDVQFIRRGWHHRDRIKTAGGSDWLTLPVLKKGKYHQEIRDVTMDTSLDWRNRLLEKIRHAYAKAPGFALTFPDIRKILEKSGDRLLTLNILLLEYCAYRLKIKTPFCLASELNVPGTATSRLVNLVSATEGSHYLTGTGSRAYLEENLFHAAGIKVIWQNFQHPEYPQLHGPFIPMLSVLDYLMMQEKIP